MKTTNPIRRSALLWSCTAIIAMQLAASAATLVHRYSFDTDTIAGTLFDNGDGTHQLVVTNVTDLVGGSAWDGTVNVGALFTNIAHGTINITNNTVTRGGLFLDPANSAYVQFPPGIISNYPAITVDAWAVVSTPWGFLWAFGNTDPGTTFGGNAVWLHCHARLTITDTMPSWGGEQNAFFAGPTQNDLNNVGYIHITGVVDPPTHRLLVYTNGILAGINTAETRSLTNVYSIYNYVAKSVFSGDALIPLTIDELRIFNGALNGLEVAGYDVAGADSLAGTVGTVTNAVVSGPYSQLVQGGHETLSVAGQATLFTDPAGTPKPISLDNFLCTFSSGNTGVLTVNSNGLVTAIKPGTTTVTAHYGSASGSITITVFPEPISLAHRYSFTNTDDGAGNLNAVIVDSVGGASWNGTIPNGGTFATNGQLSLLGASQQYVSLPTNIFSGMTNVTFDLWVTPQVGLPWNAWLFGFGDTINNDHGAYYFFVQPQSGRFAMAGLDPGWQGEQSASAAMDFSGKTNLHLTCVACTGGGYLAIYTNGVLADTYSGLTYPISSIHDNLSYINRSLYPGDPYVDLTVSEFRLYNGAMSAEQVSANDAAGPRVLGVIPPTLVVALSGGSVIASWPTNYSGYRLVSKANLTDATWNGVGTSPVVLGASYQVTLPATNKVQFFKLSH